MNSRRLLPRRRSRAVCRQAERLGSLEIYHEFKLDRFLDREVGGVRALQDFVHVNRRAAKLIDVVRRIRHEASDDSIGSIRVYGRKLIICREIHDLVAMSKQEAIRQYSHCIGFMMVEKASL